MGVSITFNNGVTATLNRDNEIVLVDEGYQNQIELDKEALGLLGKFLLIQYYKLTPQDIEDFAKLFSGAIKTWEGGRQDD